MNWSKLKEIVHTTAPTVAEALGGPLAGMATRELGRVVLDQPDAPAADIEAALERADPSILVRLRELDTEFQARLKEAGVQLEQIAANDRADARARHRASGDRTPVVLGSVIVVGFFMVLAALALLEVPESSARALFIMLGVLGGMCTQVGNYFFGSSAGSKSKTDILGELTKGARL